MIVLAAQYLNLFVKHQFLQADNFTATNMSWEPGVQLPALPL